MFVSDDVVIAGEVCGGGTEGNAEMGGGVYW